IFYFKIFNAFSTIFSTVNPYFSNNKLPGADVPNVSIPLVTPSSPTYLYHSAVAAASIETLFLISLGITEFLYSSDCASNISIDGIETPLTPYPFLFNSLLVFIYIQYSVHLS